MVPLVTPGVYSTTASYGLLAALIVILAILLVIIIKKTKRRLKIEEFPPGPRKNTQDLMILSLEKRDKTYQVCLEFLKESINPVKFVRTVDISPEMRSETITRIECASRVINTFLSLGKEPKKTGEELKKMGTVIYKNFVPRDFAQKLDHHYLILEVEDVQIPWELMYDDEFFALKYAISRRIKSEKPPVIYNQERREKKVLLIADPTETLPEATKECQYLEKHLKDSFEITYLKPEKARKVDVMYHFSQKYDIIHYAGELGESSCLPVYKGVLTCAEIERTLEGSPVVFLNGCCSAKTFSYDIEGLAKVFLERGVSSFIGSLWGIHDIKAAEFAGEFYRNCLYYPVGEALRLSRKKFYSPRDFTWAAFIMYGDPTLKIYSE
jgi:hypothetical protein